MRIQLRFFSFASLEFQVNLYAQYRTLKHERYITIQFMIMRAILEINNCDNGNDCALRSEFMEVRSVLVLVWAVVRIRN